MLLVRLTSEAHNYCEYWKWHTRGPELRSAWEDIRADVSPSRKDRDLVVQLDGTTRDSQPLSIKYHMPQNLNRTRGLGPILGCRAVAGKKDKRTTKKEEKVEKFSVVVLITCRMQTLMYLSTFWLGIYLNINKPVCKFKCLFR